MSDAVEDGSAGSGPTVAVSGLTKDYETVRAVDDLTFSVRPGAVTGFLGPNGAGKTTTLRMLLGLAHPTTGTATVAGRHYTEHARPARVVGAALEASSFHPGRTGLAHLQVLAPYVGVGTDRCREMLALVGLQDAAGRRVGGYSMGMRQRLGLAAALLGDPWVLLLDEPANGLDPEGIVWLRGVLRDFASEDRTVLVSSHVLGEVQNTVDDVVIISRGRLVRSCPLADLAREADAAVRLRSPGLADFVPHVERRGWQHRPEDGAMLVTGASVVEVGAAAFEAGIPVHELTTVGTDLERVFLGLTSPEYAAGGAADTAAGGTR